MSSNPARSSSLLPYAAPAARAFSARALSALSEAPAVSFVPFVPPTWAQVAEREAPRELIGDGSAAIATPTEGIAALEAFDEEFTAEVSEDALPWIEAFAVDPQASPSPDPQPVAETSDGEPASVSLHVHVESDSTEVSDLSDSTEAPDWSDASESSESSASTDAHPLADSDDSWAMSEASADIAQLAEELSAVSADASASAPASAVEPHLPWQEDDAWMDIMPALPHSGGRDVAAETEWARAFGEPPTPMNPPPLPTGDAQAAAASLESIARRLRAGDLKVPGFHATRGDAAALAAALAALLGASE